MLAFLFAELFACALISKQPLSTIKPQFLEGETACPFSSETVMNSIRAVILRLVVSIIWPINGLESHVVVYINGRYILKPGAQVNKLPQFDLDYCF